MIKAITAAIGSLWSKSDDQNGNDSKPEIGESAATSEANNEKQYDGKVTSLHSGYGLIDNDVYFGYDIVNGARPKVGDTVRVIAKRKHDAAGWRAAKVQVAENWETVDILEKETTPASGKETLVGRITTVDGDSGMINGNVAFRFVDTVDQYIPYRGDWVDADVKTDDATDQRFAVNVRPLRQWDTEGKIDRVCQGYGFISPHVGPTDIYFAFGALCRNYTPQRGDNVKVAAIEVSGKSKTNWRAVRVEPAREVDKLACLHRVSKLQMQNPTSPESKITQLLKEKEGVYISGQADFAKMTLHKHKTLTIWITNGGSETQTLLSYRSYNQVNECQFTIEPRSDADTTEIVIEAGSVLPVVILCKARNLGVDEQLLLFQFKNFEIGVRASVNVTDPNQIRIDASTPYHRNFSVSQQTIPQFNTKANRWTMQGQRPLQRTTRRVVVREVVDREVVNREVEEPKTTAKLPTRLQHYEVSEKFWNCVVNKDDLATVAPQLTEPLCLSNYTSRFSALLHLEEIQQEIDMREFDLQKVCLRPRGEYLALAVPGLAEGRPSVLVGDKIYLSTPGDEELGPQYEGYVHEVMNEDILLKFHEEFHSTYGGEDFNVRFTFNRTPLRRCHQAVEFAPTLGEQVLFPTYLIPKIPQMKTSTEKSSPLVKPTTGIRRCPLGRKQRIASGSSDHIHTFFNHLLNARQKAAVLRILGGHCRPTPYLLFGPPGTGKTVTLVEAILQVFHNISSSRIIACAPSNSASDLLAERLFISGHLKKGDLVRLNAFRRAGESIPTSIRDVCSDGDDLELVSRHRIVVCTCTTAGLMYSMDLLNGHFTHTFIDEAGQATEPEALIPIGLVAGADGQVVLAGDPMQLGPVLRSKQAKTFGLDLSLLERLIYSDLYARDEKKFSDHGSYDPLLVTKLVENYRSHPALLSLSSRLFYYDELTVSAEPSLIECLTQWELLPNTDNFPIVFHGLRGEDMREGNSPSWFNSVEAVQVMMYIKSLVNNTTHALTYDDIGIITPYRKQVEKIRLLIDRLGMERIKVGSVEEFQGQERLVMIISTVRSNETQIAVDIRHNLGFLSNPKRFNVSITRAQALLIIVGNPHVLSQDPMWRELVIYCVKNKAYTGCDLPELEINSETDERVHNLEHKDQTGVNESLTAPFNCKEMKANEHDSGANGHCSGDGPDSVPSFPFDSNKDELVHLPKGTLSGKPSLTTITKGDLDMKSSDTSPAPTKKMSCAKFIAQSSSPLFNKSLECKKNGTDSIDDIQWDPNDEIKVLRPDLSENYVQHLEQGQPKPQRQAKVRLVSKNRKRRERTTFERVLSQDNDTDSESTCSRDWFPTMEEWLLTDKSETSVQDKSCSDQSIEPIDTLTNSSTSIEQSEIDTCSRDDTNAKAPPWRNVEDMLNTLIKESEMYREQHSGKSERPRKENKEKRKNKAPLMERNLVLETILNNNEGNGSKYPYARNYKSAVTDICGTVNVQTVSDVVEKQKETPEEVWLEQDHVGLSSAAEAYGSVVEISEENTEAQEAPCAEDQPTELEVKIIRQVEYYFGDYNLIKDEFLLKVMEKNDGWVPLSVIATFNRMKELSPDVNVIRNALRKASNDIFQLSLGGSMISRHCENPLPSNREQWQRTLKDKCVCVEGLPSSANLVTLEKYFGKWGGVHHVEMSKPRVQRSPNSPVQLSAIVVFKDASSVKDVLNENHLYGNYFLTVSYRPDCLDILFRKTKPNSTLRQYAARGTNRTKTYNNGQMYGKTKGRTPHGESRRDQRRYDEYGQQSHGSRDYPLEGFQIPVVSALEQRPKRSPRSSRSHLHYDNPWDMDELPDHRDLAHLRPESLHVHVPNTPSSISSTHKNLANHIIQNMNTDHGPSYQQQPSDTDFCGRQKSSESSYGETDSADSFPIFHSDVRVRDRLKRESAAVLSAPRDGEQEVNEADMYDDDLAQCDSDVIIESSEEDADQN